MNNFEIDIFSRDCDHITDDIYRTCIECYRYGICEKYYIRESDKYIRSTGLDGLTSLIQKGLVNNRSQYE